MADERRVRVTWPGKAKRPATRADGTGLLPIAFFPGATPSPHHLIRGDNLRVMSALRPQLAGQLDLIYLDPPFATGQRFSTSAEVGSGRVPLPAYSDAWGGGLAGYLDMLFPRLVLARELLSRRGSLYVHLDHRAAAPVRLLLDEVFGPECFVNELVWAYKTGGRSDRLGFARKHDTILFYARDHKSTLWHPQREKSYLMHRYGFSNVEVHEDERGPYTLVGCRDVLDVPALRGNQPERVAYPTQKPEALLERLVLASSEPGSLVADLCAGSGTTLVVAARLGRRFLGCDASPLAVHVACKRLLAQPESPAFVLLREEAAAGPTEPRVRARARRLDSELVAVELVGVDYESPASLPAAACFTSAMWPDFVDLWGAGPASEGGEGRWIWGEKHAPPPTLDRVVQRHEGSLPRRLTLRLSPAIERVRLQVFDVFGGDGAAMVAIE